MANLSLIERINIIFDAIRNNEITKYFIPGMIVFMILLIIFAKSKKKFIKIISGVISIILIGLFIFYFRVTILSFFDYFIEVIVNNILFPNLALYMVTIIGIDIALIISLTSNRISNLVKNINILFFTLMQVFLFFIIENVITNNVNVYEMLSIYTNQELLVLVEGSMIIFSIWIILLLFIKVAKVLTRKEKKEIVNEKINNEIVINYNDEVNENEFIEYVPIKKKRV